MTEKTKERVLLSTLQIKEFLSSDKYKIPECLYPYKFLVKFKNNLSSVFSFETHFVLFLFEIGLMSTNF